MSLLRETTEAPTLLEARAALGEAVEGLSERYPEVAQMLEEQAEEMLGVYALAAEVAANDAEWGEGLSEIELVGEEDFRFFTAALPFPVLAQAGKMSERAATLRALVPEILRRYGEVRSVDLRFARRIIVEPMAVPAGAPASADVETL